MLNEFEFGKVFASANKRKFSIRIGLVWSSHRRCPHISFDWKLQQLTKLVYNVSVQGVEGVRLSDDINLIWPSDWCLPVVCLCNTIRENYHQTSTQTPPLRLKERLTLLHFITLQKTSHLLGWSRCVSRQKSSVVLGKSHLSLYRTSGKEGSSSSFLSLSMEL